MGHLPSPVLTRFEKGKQLFADDLNANFLTLLALLEGLAREVRTPDQVVVELEKRAGAVEARTTALEYLTSMHARQRNEREWAPLSYVGALVTMVNDLRRDMEASVARVDGIARTLLEERYDHERRLQRLEQQPDYARQEDFAPLVADHKRLALKEHMLMAQIIALRHETGLLREIAMGRAREANKVEYAPLSYVGHILQRLNAIEARL